MYQFSDKLLPTFLKNILLAQLSFTVTPLEHRPERNNYFLAHFSTSRLQRSIRLSGVSANS